jgi:trans-2,3-dihydro-3-hydroxyanthranilate isomerase
MWAMPALRYLHLDVFTEQPFEGNQLAVFPDPSDVSGETMQRIANEMAFSETTFILPPEDGGDVRMRIFTPQAELPMAGHPTIGSTFALAETGRIEPSRRQFVFELGVGPTPVELEWEEGRLAFAWMTQRLPDFGPAIDDREALAEALGLRADDLAASPAQVVSCGVPFLFVPLRHRQAVDAVAIERRALVAALAGVGEPEHGVFVFSQEPGAGPEDVYSRMLAPGLGIAEDPATGGASGPLGAYLLHYGLVAPEKARRLLSLQGVAMGRPSRIHIDIESDDGGITRVRIGGRSELVGTGELRFGR